MIRVLVCDDHAIVRQGLRQIIDEQQDMNTVAEAGGYPDVMKQLREHQADLVLLDISMPGKNGIEILKLVKKEFPKLVVLVLSMYPEDQYAVRAIRAGASGYLTKQSAADQLITAIRQVSAGRKYITPELAQSFKLNAARGVLITQVERGSPADKGGIKPGDILLAVNDRPIADSITVLNLIASLPPGQQAIVRLSRNQAETDLTVTVGRRPRPQQRK